MKEHQPQPSYGRQDRDRRGFEDYGQRHGEVRRGGERGYRESGEDIEHDYGAGRRYGGASGRDYESYGDTRRGAGAYAYGGREDDEGEREDYAGLGRSHFDERFSVHGSLPAGSGYGRGGERMGAGEDYGRDYGTRRHSAFEGERGAYRRGGERGDYDYYGRGRDPSGYGGGIYGGSADTGYPGWRDSERGGRMGGESWRRGGRDWGGMHGESATGHGERGHSWGGEADRGYGYGARGQDFRGRGPKGYTRSDERITEDICERLTRDPQIDASDISVEVHEGTVTLRGTVDERWMKHRVEDVADGCSGVKDVRNELRIAKGAGGSDGSGLQQGGSEGRAAGTAAGAAGSTGASAATGTGNVRH